MSCKRLHAFFLAWRGGVNSVFTRRVVAVSSAHQSPILERLVAGARYPCAAIAGPLLPCAPPKHQGAPP
jgi:hypothetical protein